MASSHGRSLLAVVCLRVHARQLLHRRRGGGVGVSELWRSATALAALVDGPATTVAQPTAAAAAAAQPAAAAAAVAAAAAAAASPLDTVSPLAAAAAAGTPLAATESLRRWMPPLLGRGRPLRLLLQHTRVQLRRRGL